MLLTRYEHACLVLEHEHERLVIDPGGWTRPLGELTGVVGVVVTHEHADHWADAQLRALREANPGMRILGPDGVAIAATNHPVERVRHGDVVEVGGFRLEFFGEKHAVIHESIPVVDNVGVLVNGALYYGGDAYTAPGVAVPVLAAPVGAPWLKIGEAMDYVLAVAPARSFAVHDLPLSEVGLQMQRARIAWATEQGGGAFVALEPGDTLEL
ncbi:MAG: MBL fold metallo-hydrolase [Archangium gephyra]|uniref:MBL fold metallo-hydrolase n=1 Tax=Archangium gephyra TaxID=48 RepID=A0A2W5SNZ4_9BACT|nr:MAG: MBL fold metallo-hydrolase [Archangium gephyra]